MIDAGAGDPRILTTKQVAQLIQASDQFVVRGIYRGVIPASRLGAEWRYWKPSVLRAVLRTSDTTTEPDEPPEVITAQELAALFQMAPHTVLLRINDRSIPATRVAKGWRIHWPTIRERLENGKDFTPR